MRKILVVLALCTVGGAPVQAEAPLPDDPGAFEMAQSSEGRFRLLNASAMVSEAQGKSFNISSNPATLRLSAQGQKALVGRQFSLRLFRVDTALGRPRPIDTVDGCEVYYSAIVRKNIVTGDLVFTQFTAYWLGRRGSTLGDETYLLMLEDGLDDNGVIKLRPGLAEQYFKYGFRIVVTRSHDLTAETIKLVLDFASDDRQYQQLQRKARCVDSPNLLTAGASIDGLGETLVARHQDCQA
jgi:hypothetical protein